MTLAKCFKFSMTLLFILIICSACQSNKEEGPKEYISYDELKSLAEKGVSLNWGILTSIPLRISDQEYI